MSWNFWKKPEPTELPEPARAESFFSTHVGSIERRNLAQEALTRAINAMPKVQTAGTMDSSDTVSPLKVLSTGQQAISETLANWYASHSFIGHQMCALLAQHWLIDKACSMPARDATRNGFEAVTVDGDELSQKDAKILKEYDKAYRVKWNCEQFVRMGRIFGIRIALFKVQSDDPNYYEYPFNPDGIQPGSYKGISQIDPYWCAPVLNAPTTSDPSSIHFYEPDYWQINGKKIHRSHLCIFRSSEPPDILKPAYLYGGIPVSQQIMERVYGAERTANEGPLLASSKRTNVWRTDMEAFKAAGDEAVNALHRWTQYRDNFGLKLGDKEKDEFQQFETSLADLDNVIMNQYQLVAAAARVPATKLLGTSPKGFNATGEYEEANYHEELESIQEHDLTPMVERHHLLVMRSFGDPSIKTGVTWMPLDAPTTKEVAETNLIKAQTGNALVQSGAVSAEEERQRVAMDPDSGYVNIGAEAEDNEVLNDIGLSDESKEVAKGLDLD